MASKRTGNQDLSNGALVSSKHYRPHVNFKGA